MIKLALWYMLQPIACYIHSHDWYKGDSYTRVCGYCGRVEVYKGLDSLHRPIWEKQDDVKI